MATRSIVGLLSKDFSDKGKLRSHALKYRELRLEALQTAPEAFASSYSRESQFDIDTWEGRLITPSARHFIVLKGSTEHENLSDHELLDELPWVGLVVLNGPIIFNGVYPTPSESPWQLFSSGPSAAELDALDPTDSSKTLIFTMTGVYVSPVARGLGAGKMAIMAAIDLAKKRLEGKAWKGLFIILVEKGNDSAFNLYKACGFSVMREDEYERPDGGKGISISMRQDLQ